MVRIPRAEPTLEPRIANMPNLAGDGWGAPGRATVQLGQSIASLGDAFEGMGGGISAEAQAEQDFNDKMVMLKTDNELGLNQIEAQNTYQGTGDDYLPQRSEYYSTKTEEALGQISERGQPKAQLFFEQRRGPYLERDATFGGQRRQDTLMTTIDEAVTTEYGKLATVPPEEFESRFQQTITGVDAIIQAAPLPDTLKDKISGQAADRGFQILRGLAEDPETAPEIVPRILKMIETPPAEVQGGALEEVPAQDVAPDQVNPEGVQGLPGGPSGPALAKPQKLGAADVAPPQGQQSIVQMDLQDFTSGRTHFRPLAAQKVKNIVLHDVSGNPSNRRLPKGGNIPNYHITFDDKGIYNEIPLDRQAPHARAFNKDSIGIAYIGFEGDKLSPQAVANGARAVQAVSERFGITPDRILTHPGAGPSATKSGKDPREAAWRTEVLSYIENGGDTRIASGPVVQSESGAAPAVSQRGVTQFAGMSNLGGPEDGGRAPNTIPGEPKLVSGPEQAVRVADASGKFVPQKKLQTWRSVDSQLKGLLLKNMGDFKRMEAEASRKAERIADEKTRDARSGSEREGLELMFANKLTKQWVEENGPLLSNDTYSRFMSAVTPKTRTTDPSVYTDLLERADERPEEVIDEASDAYATGRLDQEAFERIYSKAGKALSPDTKNPPWVKEYRSMVKRSIRPEAGDRTVDSMREYGETLEKFDEYVEEQKAAGKGIDRKSVAAFADQTVTEFKMSKVASQRKAISMPRFSQVGRDAMTLDEVNASIQRTLEAAKSGKIRPEELKLEAANLRKWKEALEAEAVAKGEKIAPPKPVQKPAAQQRPSPKADGGEDLGGKTWEDPMCLGGPKEQDKAKPEPQGESRPLGGGLGVIPLAENPDGSVSLSVPGMILEPWRAFQRGWARQGQVGQMNEDGTMYTAADAARDSSGDAATAAGMPLAATSFGSAIGAVPKGALGSGMARTGETAATKAVDPQGFYSGLDEALKGFKPTDSVTAETLAKRGVKKAEIEARGMSGLLADGKSARVSDLQKMAGENRVDVREVIYAPRKREPRAVENSKWHNYSLDLENPTYRETVLHLPASRSIEDFAASTGQTITPANRSIIEASYGMDSAKDFRSGHWSEPNVIAHARTSIQKDAQGKDVFVVNELQSDWGQKIRDGGALDQTKIAAARQRLGEQSETLQALSAQAEDLTRAVRARVGDEPFLKAAANGQPMADWMGQLYFVRVNGTAEEKALATSLRDKLKPLDDSKRLLEAELRTMETSAPGHPLVNTTDQWVNTSLRRMIAQAVESGSDQIAIPSGETIKSFGMGGKEDGIKYAYDEMYPKNLRNLLKKIDPSIEPVKVDHLFGQKGEALERSKGFITFKITPKLRDAIKKEGQPLFSGGVPVDGAAMQDEDAE